MDQSATQSQENTSSAGTSSQPSDPQTSSDPRSSLYGFVNHGMFAVICVCISNRTTYLEPDESRPRVREPINISEDENLEIRLWMNEPLPRTVPLGQWSSILLVSGKCRVCMNECTAKTWLL